QRKARIALVVEGREVARVVVVTGGALRRALQRELRSVRIVVTVLAAAAQRRLPAPSVGIRLRARRVAGGAARRLVSLTQFEACPAPVVEALPQRAERDRVMTARAVLLAGDLRRKPRAVELPRVRIVVAGVATLVAIEVLFDPSELPSVL